MVRNFGTRDEVKDATQDLLLFDISYSPRTLGKTYRIVGAVLPLDKAEIVPVIRTIDPSTSLGIDPERSRGIEVESKPRYKALIALCLCAGLIGVGAIAFIANSANSPSESIAYAAKRKGTPRPPGRY